MRGSVQELIRDFIAVLGESEVVKKFKPSPKIKPPRRRPDVQNKSNRSDYMKNYIREYREKGKDYQKIPERLKEYRKEKKRERKLQIKSSENVGIRTDTPHLTIY